MVNEEVNVAVAKRKERQWTVMVYMVAGDSAEMDDYAVRDLREMERGAHEDVYVAIQIKRHWPDIPQRYVISRDERLGMARLKSAAGLKSVDMGDDQTLAKFLDWAVKECPAKHYMLVLWGHAYGLGFGRDHGDPLKLSELVTALTAFRDKRTELKPEVSGRAALLDILGTNACAMSYVEAAYELRERANYLLASQLYVPFAGWPYDSVLKNITKETSPEQLGLNVIDSYIAGLNNALSGERVQMSLLDLSKAEGLLEATEGLATAIQCAFRSNNQFDGSRRASIRDTFLAAAAGDVRPLVDLKDLSRGLRRDLCDVQALAFAASSELGDLERLRLEWLEATANDLKQKLVDLESVCDKLTVKTDAHPSLANLGGVGIYVPFVTDEQDLKRLGLEVDDSFRSRTQDRKSETSRETYEGLALFSMPNGKRGTWPTLVYDDLNEPIPSELVDLIADIGVTNLNDRAEIAQIVLSIESTFNKLDRVLAVAESVVKQVLRQAQSEAHKSSPSAKEPLPRLFGLKHPNEEKQKAAPPLQIPEPILRAWFRKLEAALEEVERTTKKGLTQARFGLGPVASPRGFDAPVKLDYGAARRDDNRGFAPVKLDLGAPGRDENRGFAPVKLDLGALREDENRGFAPVKLDLGASVGPTTFANTDVIDGKPEVRPAFLLFSRAADALRRLEQATSEFEDEAGQSLGKEIFDQRDLRLRQAFAILCETATSARRTIRRVIANPAYGLGPSAAAFDRDDREELANAAGLSARSLLLLSVDPLAPEPDLGQFLRDEQEHKKYGAHDSRVHHAVAAATATD